MPDIEDVPGEVLDKGKAGAGKVGGLLTRKIGPLPVWAWASVVGVAGYIGLKLRNGSASGSDTGVASSVPSSGRSATAGGTAAPAVAPTYNLPTFPTTVGDTVGAIAPPNLPSNGMPGIASIPVAVAPSAIRTPTAPVVVPQALPTWLDPSDITSKIEYMPESLPGADAPIVYSPPSESGSIQSVTSFTGPNAAEDVGRAYADYLEANAGHTGGAS